MDTDGAEACRPFIERARPEHPSLIDVAHLMAERFGVVNVPNGVWIDEDGMIVRPAEPAYPRSLVISSPRGDEPEHILAMMEEASKIPTEADAYVAALRDWVANGGASRFALAPDEVVARSGHRDKS